MSQIHTQWSHFWRLLVTVDFDVSFNTKEWLVDHINIVIYINGVCYRGYSEKWQIHAQYCTYCAPTPFLYTLHSSKSCFGGLNER